MSYIKTKKQKFLFSLFFFLLIAGSFGLKGSHFLAHPALAQVTLTDMSPDPSSAATQDEIDSIGKSGFHPIGELLVGILSFMGFLIRVATTLFNWVINPADMRAILTNTIIYTSWALVRDTLNIAFILVLLFSAFSTVFQVDKYSYKKLLLTLVLMALLVNFSFPITRFIIDFSNSLMYFLLNSSGIGISNVNAAFPSIAEGSQLGKILAISPDASTLSLISAIIFTWILAITLLIIAGLFVIRTVALAILIIFSPIAFTGSIIPFSASYASKWWDNLFKYAFFGPVMIFMLSVSVKMMSAIQISSMANMTTAAGQQSADPSVLAAASFFIIPIIILWAGIIFAQQMSLMGASAVIGRGQKFMKWAPSAVGAGAWWGAKQSGYPGAISKKWDHYKKTGPLFGSDVREEREARRAGKGLFAVPHVTDQADAKRIKEAKETHDMEHMLARDLQNMKKTGNKFEQAAAIQELANRGQAEKKDLDQIRSAFGGETSQTFKALASKVKAYDPVAAFSHIASDADRMTAMQEFMNSNQFDVKKIGASSLDNDEFMEVMLANNAISTKDMIDLSKSSPGKKDAIKRTLGKLALEKNIAKDELSQKVQMSYFALNGELSKDSSGNTQTEFAKHIFSTATDETMSNITAETAKANTENIALYTKNIKKVINGIKSDVSRRAIISDLGTKTYISRNTDPVLRETENMNSRVATNVASKDPQMRMYK